MREAGWFHVVKRHDGSRERIREVRGQSSIQETEGGKCHFVRHLEIRSSGWQAEKKAWGSLQKIGGLEFRLLKIYLFI